MPKLTRLLILAVLMTPACNRRKPSEGSPPPAAVKWKKIADTVVEEGTELVGTTVPLPDHFARVTAPIEGRVVAILTEANGSPVIEGQRVDKGAVLVKLDDTVVRANLAK